MKRSKNASAFEVFQLGGIDSRLRYFLSETTKSNQKALWCHSEQRAENELFLCFKAKSGGSGSETQALLAKHNETAHFLSSTAEMTPLSATGV